MVNTTYNMGLSSPPDPEARGDFVPVGCFCGGDSVPAGTFHGGDSVPAGTFHSGDIRSARRPTEMIPPCTAKAREKA